MTTPSPIKPPRSSRRQRGAAILIMVLILMLGLITLFTFRMDRRGPELEADRKTALALAQAKEALLGRAASSNTPGRITCPALNTLGAPPLLAGNNCQGNAGIPQNAGRVAWRTLRVENLIDGAAEQLWVVIAPAFVDNGDPINSTVVLGNTMSIIGSAPQNDIVAIIVAPGPPLTGQDHSAGAMNNYLEGYFDSLTFNTAPPSPAYNDRILTISARELLTRVTQRITRELANTPGVGPYLPLLMLPKPGVWAANNWDAAIASYVVSTTNTPDDTLIMQFANCSSLFTFQWDGVRNNVTSNGGC